MSDHFPSRSGDDQAVPVMLKRLGQRIHALNRIGGDESRFYWLAAEASRKLGRLLERAEDPEFLRQFSDADSPGSLPLEDQEEVFWTMLRSL